MRKDLVVCWIVVLSFVSAALAQSAPESSATGVSGDLADISARLENAQRRVERLEAEVAGLEAGAAGNASANAELAGELKALEVKARAAGAEGSGFGITPYGRIKVDMNFDDSRMNATDDGSYVRQEAPGFGSDKYFALTVRQTTLGLNISGPDIAGGKQKARIEIDFYAPASVENKPELRLKYGYWELSQADWSILAGLAPDVFSPRSPSTVNRPHLNNSGDIGYRRPMIRYRKLHKLEGEKSLQTDLAAGRTTGGTVSSASSLDDAGSDAAWPALEARTGLSLPTSREKPVVLGVSGHVGQEEYDPASGLTGKGAEYMTYSANIDWSLPVTSRLEVNGEVWGGRNLDDFVGGIGQGVNTTLGKPIDAYGGWIQLLYKTPAAWTLSIGGGIDDPDNSDLNAGDRDRNATFFSNAVYAFSANLSAGVEVSYIKTNYKGGNDGDNVRVQGALMYQF